MAILLVIDMCPGRFKASGHPWMVQNVSREILRAKRLHWAIAFVEYSRLKHVGGVMLKDRTDQRLIRLVDDYAGDYDFAFTVHKHTDGGTKEILYAIDKWCYGFIYGGDGEMRVVGVNTEGCVAKVVNGLSKAKPKVKITVVGDACNGVLITSGGSRYPDGAGLREIIRRRNGNVRVLQQGLCPPIGKPRRMTVAVDRSFISLP